MAYSIVGTEAHNSLPCCPLICFLAHDWVRTYFGVQTFHFCWSFSPGSFMYSSVYSDNAGAMSTWDSFPSNALCYLLVFPVTSMGSWTCWGTPVLSLRSKMSSWALAFETLTLMLPPTISVDWFLAHRGGFTYFSNRMNLLMGKQKHSGKIVWLLFFRQRDHCENLSQQT